MSALKDILYKVSIEAVKGNTDVTIARIAFDSREVEAGTAFVAIRGTVSDGHGYIETAISKGASAIICDTLPNNIASGVTYVQVRDTASASRSKLAPSSADAGRR